MKDLKLEKETYSFKLFENGVQSVVYTLHITLKIPGNLQNKYTRFCRSPSIYILAVKKIDIQTLVQTTDSQPDLFLRQTNKQFRGSVMDSLKLDGHDSQVCHSVSKPEPVRSRFVVFTCIISQIQNVKSFYCLALRLSKNLSYDETREANRESNGALTTELRIQSGIQSGPGFESGFGTFLKAVQK